ncbi:MAG TPA: hypothetical protein VGA55_00935 [Bacteroidota bacterium]
MVKPGVNFSRMLAGVSGLILLGSLAAAQTPGVTASLDSTHFLIGDWINLRVDAEMPPDLRAVAPPPDDSAGAFEILAVEELEPSGQNGVKRQSWIIRLTTFEPGDAKIPPIPFAFVGQNGDTVTRALTGPVSVSIGTLELDEKAVLKDIKPPLTPPWGLEDVVPYLIVALVLAAIFGGYYWYSKRKRKVSAVEPLRPAIPPHQLALYALRDLENKRLWQQGMVKEYYSEATEIIRRFFEGRFGIVALEMTSDEILQQLKGVPSALPPWKDINAFLLTADLVKFAKYQPTMAEHEAELQLAYGIVRAMTPKPEPSQEKEVSSAHVG